MEPNWKVDITNLGLCKSLSKELAATYPNYQTFLSTTLLSDPSTLTPEALYHFFIPLLSSVQQELYSSETELRISQDSIASYKAKLDQLQQENLQKSGGQLSKFPKNVQISRRDSIKITLDNLKSFNSAATRIQKFWKGASARMLYKKKISEIITKVRPTGPRSLPNDKIMQIVTKEIEKKKLTMEQFYRAADKDCDGKVSFEELKSFLDSLGVILPRSTLTRFVQIIDEDCSGIIDKTEFFHALAAYNVGKEDSGNERTFEEDMLLKLVKIMQGREIDPENMFAMCDTDSSGSMSLKEFEKYLIKLKVGFKVREVHALMRKLDTDGNGELSLEEFKKQFTQGQSFFKQEVISSTSAMMPTQSKVGFDEVGIRELFRTLEYTGSFMQLLASIKSLPNSEISVSSFYVTLEKSFNCKLTKAQIETLRKVLVLNEKGMISFETFKPVAIRYTTKALETRENYVIRVKTFLPATKPEEKIFTKKEMVEELFFSPEQCMEAIQFLAEPGEDYFSSDFFYAVNEKSSDSVLVDKEKVIEYFKDKIKDSGLDIRNIFRFADKKNEGEVPISTFVSACEKLLKDVQDQMLEDLQTVLASDYVTLESLVGYFPPFKVDRNGLSVEAVYWLRYLGKTFRDAKMTSTEFFKSIPPDAQGKATFLNLKQKIKQMFESIILPKRVFLISESIFDSDSAEIDNETFIKLFVSCQNTDHSITDLKEYERKVQKILEDDKKVLPPPAVKPVIQPPVQQPSAKIVIKATNPVESDSMMESLKKISQKVPEGRWALELLGQFGLSYEYIFANDESLFYFTQNFGMTKNENHDVYLDIVKKNKGEPLVYAYQFCCLVDMVSHSLVNLPLSWNKSLSGQTAILFGNYPKLQSLKKLDLLQIFKNPDRKLDFTFFENYKGEKSDIEKILSFFHPNSPIYHFLSVIDSYMDEKIHSVFNIMKSKIFFNSDFFKKPINLDALYENEAKMKELLFGNVFNDIEIRYILKFLYPNFQKDFTGYGFQYLVDVVQANRKKLEISFDPLNTVETEEGNKKYFALLSFKFKFPLFYYFGSNELNKFVMIRDLKARISEHFDNVEGFRLDSLGVNNSVPIYHFLAVLDSYRSRPLNLNFDLTQIFQIFSPKTVPISPRRADFAEKYKNLSKEKLFTHDEIKAELLLTFPDLTEDEKSDFIFFIDPFNTQKPIYGYQLLCIFELCETESKFKSFPFMLNTSTPKPISDVFYRISNSLDSNKVATLSLSNINLNKKVNPIDLNTIKPYLDPYKALWPDILKTMSADSEGIPFYYILTAIESYRAEDHKPIGSGSKNLGVFPENFLRLIDKTKKLVTIFNNPPLNQIFEFKSFKQLFEVSFQGISQEIIERLFKKIDKRSFNRVFMYEILTAIDVMQKNSNTTDRVRFMYVDEFQVMPENTGQSNPEYVRKKEAHKRYIQLAEIFDENSYPTYRLKSLRDQSVPQQVKDFTGYEKITVSDLTKYIFRVTNKSMVMTEIFENLKVQDEVTFYHFFAVFESYRKKVFVDKDIPVTDMAKAVSRAPIQRNPNDIVLPAKTDMITPGSFNSALYELKLKVKSDYKNIYNKFRNHCVNTQLMQYEEFKLFVREICPRISEVNLNELIKSVDKDKDKNIDFEEFFNYVFCQPFEPEQPKPVQRAEERKLVQNDYFDPRKTGLTTILNSESAAVIRCKELLSETPHGQCFKDKDFGPEVGSKGDTCLYWNGKPPSSNYPDPKSPEFVWKSAKDAFPQSEFFKNGTMSADVIQGSLGDCWFIGALSVMALRDDLLYGNIEKIVNPEDITIKNGQNVRKGVFCALFQGPNAVGMYVLKFFINSAWRWVVIDDRIPLFEDPEDKTVSYVFGHCKDPTELWVSLIEKAYAKIFGCYEALNGGLIDDGLTDLTGLVAENCRISGKGGFLTGVNDEVKNNELWEKLVRYRADKTLMGCSIEGEGVESDVIVDGERTGLLARHAYAIIDILTLDNPAARKGRHRLLRIRNPWGQREWQGRWCDGSPELEQFAGKINEIASKLGDEEKFSKFDPEDGTFFMNFKSWRRIFHNLYACVDFSEKWSGKRFAGEWTSATSGGVPMTGTQNECVRWAKNPQYCFNLTKDTEMFFSLAQEDGRYAPNSKFPFEASINTACFAILTGTPEDQQILKFDQGKIVKLSVLKVHRNIEMRLSLKPGKYFVVPSTMEAGKTGKFWLSVYFDCQKREISIFNCRNSSEIGEFILEEEESDQVLTENDLNTLRQTFGSLLVN